MQRPSRPPARLLLRDRATGKMRVVPGSALPDLEAKARLYWPGDIAQAGPPVPEPVQPSPVDNYQAFPEGVPSVPTAEWEQNPGGANAQWETKPANSVRWGDMKSLDFPANTAGPAVTLPTLYLLNMQLKIPAMVVLRLSAVEMTGAVTAPGPNDVVTWSVETGVGAALQTKQYLVQVAPVDGSADTDLVLTSPVEILRVSAQVVVKLNAADHTIQCVAMAAPFTAYPEMVS